MWSVVVGLVGNSGTVGDFKPDSGPGVSLTVEPILGTCLPGIQKETDSFENLSYSMGLDVSIVGLMAPVVRGL